MCVFIRDVTRLPKWVPGAANTHDYAAFLSTLHATEDLHNYAL